MALLEDGCNTTIYLLLRSMLIYDVNYEDEIWEELNCFSTHIDETLRIYGHDINKLGNSDLVDVEKLLAKELYEGSYLVANHLTEAAFRKAVFDYYKELDFEDDECNHLADFFLYCHTNYQDIMKYQKPLQIKNQWNTLII